MVRLNKMCNISQILHLFSMVIIKIKLLSCWMIKEILLLLSIIPLHNLILYQRQNPKICHFGK